MIDLIALLSNFDSKDGHHRAAIYELERLLPEELLREDADWVTIYKGRVDPKSGGNY